MRKILVIFMGAIFMLSSCISLSINFEKVEDWHDPKIYNAAGSVSILNDGVTELIPCTGRNYAIKATLKNGDKEKQVFLLVDTGSFQNVLYPDVVDFFDSKTDSGYKFTNRIAYADFKFSSTKGYYFEKLESTGFVIDNILFQELPSNFLLGNTLDGNRIDGEIGMCALRQLPFKFSIKDKELAFYKTDKDFPAGERIQFNKKKLPFRLLTELKLTNNTRLDAYLDTGAFTSIVPEEKIRKIKYTNSIKSFEKVYKNSTESYIVWHTLAFANQNLSDSLIYSRTGLKERTVGTNILENYDFYVNTKDGYGIFVPESKNAEMYCLKKYINISEGNDGNFNFFGFTVDKYKVLNLGVVFTSSIGQKFVTCVYYIDGKPIFGNIKPGDELISINGISCKDFPWNTFHDLQEADFVFKRGKKEIKLYASRQNYIGDKSY
jgi:hypothetical protein